MVGNQKGTGTPEGRADASSGRRTPDSTTDVPVTPCTSGRTGWVQTGAGAAGADNPLVDCTPSDMIGADTVQVT